MSSNIETKKPKSYQWRWFAGLYASGLAVYGVVEFGLHYLNALLLRL